MPNALSIKNVSAFGGKQRRIRYGIVLSGAYVQANAAATPPTGEVLNLGAATGNYDSQQYWGYQGPAFGAPTQPTAGYTWSLLPTSSPNLWVLKIWSSPGTELAAGNYSAAVLADLSGFVEFWGANWK